MITMTKDIMHKLYMPIYLHEYQFPYSNYMHLCMQLKCFLGLKYLHEGSSYVDSIQAYFTHLGVCVARFRLGGRHQAT